MLFVELEWAENVHTDFPVYLPSMFHGDFVLFCYYEIDTAALLFGTPVGESWSGQKMLIRSSDFPVYAPKQ